LTFEYIINHHSITCKLQTPELVKFAFFHLDQLYVGHAHIPAFYICCLAIVQPICSNDITYIKIHLYFEKSIFAIVVPGLYFTVNYHVDIIRVYENDLFWFELPDFHILYEFHQLIMWKSTKKAPRLEILYSYMNSATYPCVINIKISLERILYGVKVVEILF
jgi:hypothetical protein